MMVQLHLSLQITKAKPKINKKSKFQRDLISKSLVQNLHLIVPAKLLAQILIIQQDV
jgi:hypothetical protein